MADPVFKYDEVFSLILSLVEQVSKDKGEGYLTSDTLDDYFKRLTKRTLGEYEFARRMAFEHVNLVRLAPYPILREKFKQPITMDFLMYFNGKKACVDVKCYDMTLLKNKIIIHKHLVDDLITFKTQFGLDAAYLGIKRYETWYLVDVEELKKAIPLTSEKYESSFSDLKKLSQLKETRFILNTGRRAMLSPFPQPDSGTEFGVLCMSWQDDPSENKICFKYSKNAASTSKSDERELKDIQAKIMRIIYQKITKYAHFLIHENDHPTKINELEDFLPTLFSVFDSLPELKDKEGLERAMKPTLDAEYIYQDNSYSSYHFGNVWSIIKHHAKEEGFI